MRAQEFVDEDLTRRGFLRGMGAVAVAGAAGSALAQNTDISAAFKNMQQDDPRVRHAKDVADLAKAIYQNTVAERGQPMDRRQQNTWMEIAHEKAAARFSQYRPGAQPPAKPAAGFPSQGSEYRRARDIDNFESVEEAFDHPYKGKWEKSEYGDVDMLAKLPDGTNLSIMFNQEYGDEGEEVVQVEFYRNNSQEVTGEGDAQRIFATVLNAIQKYIKKYKPSKLSFSASKATDPTIYYEPDQPQPNPESRAKLYDRLVQRYARAWGYQASRADNGDLVIYELSRLKQGVVESVNDYLWHGSRYRNEVLVPRQANDTGGKEESNKNAIYATPSAKVAIAMGLTTPGSDTGMFPNDPQMVLFKGGIRKGEMVYLHKVPKDLFIKHNSREWYSKPDVKEITPIEVVTVPVDKWLSLIRTATPKDLELQKKNMKKQGVAEGLDDNRVSFKVQKGKNKFATTLSVGGYPVGVYQYDANTGRSIAEIYPEFKGKGLGKLLVLHAIYTAANLGLDFQEDESRTSEYDNVLDSLSSNGYIVDDDGYWYVTSQGEQYLQQSLKQDVAEDHHNDTAISLSKLGKFHPGADTLAEFVPERASARYALHPDKWESTFYSLTNKDSDKLKYYGPKKISIPPGTLVGDMAIANKFYRAKTPEEQEQYAELYKASLKPYPVDVSEYRMPELLIPKHGVAEQQLDELNFLGSECTKDCSGHRAGYEWSKRKGLRQANSLYSPSFNKGAALAVAGK